MHIGYARISTLGQNLDIQLDALTQAGCQTIYTETMSGAKRHRPELEATLKSLRPNDTLVMWRLDRLGRSLMNLVDIINDLEERDIAFRSLTESIDTQSSTGKLVFKIKWGRVLPFSCLLTNKKLSSARLIPVELRTFCQ
ncbi:recombinase family protein [Pseudoalteromonas sp. T1lg21]|uniref:recombinase family protein n=1 Tax=Pseudoalteromonas sp. T1lg21 TaxID=2077095 RepID=UPI000CF70F23|nr:recombinase family protein [Pseudoalteromonas sp. T1lg21]